MPNNSTINNDFADALLDEASKTPYKFTPSAFHNVEGDCLEIVLSDEPYHGERLSDTITVLMGEESGRPVGLIIKKVQALFDDFGSAMPGWVISIQQNHCVKVEYLIFFMQNRKQLDGEQQAVYEVLEEIRELADETSVTLTPCLA